MKSSIMLFTIVSSVFYTTASIAQTAQSAGTGYVGIQASQLDIDIDAPTSPIDIEPGTSVNIDSISSFKPTSAIAKLGYNVVDYIAIEGRVGTGVTDDSGSISGSISLPEGIVEGELAADMELDTMAGLYAVGRLPLGDSDLSLYGVLGYTYMEITSTIEGYSESLEESGVSYGAGVQAQLTAEVSANLEYMSYLDKSDYDINAIGLGISYHYQH